MSPEVARRVVRAVPQLCRPPTQADYELTPHEIRLLKLLTDGHNYKTAAAELGITVHTSVVPSASGLREAAGPLQNGSGRQGATPRVAGLTPHGLGFLRTCVVT